MAFTPSTHFIRSCILYDFHAGITAAASLRRISDAFGNGSTSKSTVNEWFGRFKKKEFDISDKARSGRPSSFSNENLSDVIEANSSSSSRKISMQMNCSHTTVLRHLKEIGKVPRLGPFVPHQLTENQKKRRMDACTILLSVSRRVQWLETVVTGDEKWVMHVNMPSRLQWVDKGQRPSPIVKPDTHGSKVMLSVWWDVEGVISYEFLPDNQTITSEYYCEQLDRLRQQLQIKRPHRSSVYFQHDNARPHVAKLTQQKLLDFGWTVMPHPAYSPDLAPSDYHLFRSLEHFLKGKTFQSRDEISKDIDSFFSQKSTEFFRAGIMKLPERWRHVLNGDGEYIID